MPHLVTFVSLALLVIAGCDTRSRDPWGDLARSFIERVATESAAADALVRIGGDAVPAVLAAVQRTSDARVREPLLDVLGRIADPRARPVLDELLARCDGDAGRVAVLEAMYRCGDESVVGEVLRIGLADERQRSDAARALSRHESLRRALGFDGESWVDEELMLRAADEWYHEEVLGKPSPWRPTEITFPEPFAAEKRAAFARLVQHVEARNDDQFGNLRVYCTDPGVTDVDGPRPLAVLAGRHHTHGDTLVVHVWFPTRDPVVGYRLVASYRSVRTSFPGDYVAVRCERVTVQRAEFRAMVAGLRTVLSARLTAWWSGSEWNSVCFLNTDVAFAISGVGEDRDNRHCGPESTSARQHRERLEVADAWHAEFVAQQTVAECDGVPDDAKAAFSALFLSLFGDEHSDLRHWTWVREMLTRMACDAGDASLRAPLARLLRPWHPARDVDERTAAAAINALAAITGTDLRFHADGSPRPVADVAASYRELLAR